MNTSYRNTKGFTLIELLVVVAIIGIMSSISLVSLRRGHDQRVVDSAARQVAATIRMAQSYAVTGRYANDGKIPCVYRFFAQSSTGAYGVEYTYHTKSNPTCTTTAVNVASYTVTDGVSISDVPQIVFKIPQGTVDQNIDVVTRVRVSKNAARTDICVDGFGRIQEDC